MSASRPAAESLLLRFQHGLVGRYLVSRERVSYLDGFPGEGVTSMVDKFPGKARIRSRGAGALTRFDIVGDWPDGPTQARHSGDAVQACGGNWSRMKGDEVDSTGG